MEAMDGRKGRRSVARAQNSTGGTTDNSSLCREDDKCRVTFSLRRLYLSIS